MPVPTPWLASPAAGLPPSADAAVACVDFFGAARDRAASFEAAFDYTFCCALPPPSRAEWAAAYRSLLAPGAVLIALIFPVEATDEARAKQGPPWPITPEDYQALLADGFACESLAPIPPSLSHRGRGGRAWMGVWRRVEEGSKL